MSLPSAGDLMTKAAKTASDIFLTNGLPRTREEFQSLLRSAYYEGYSDAMDVAIEQLKSKQAT